MVNMDTHFASHLKSIYEIYEDLLKNKGVPGLKNWSFMDNPLPTILICLSYIYFCKVIGPQLMKHRRPFRLGYGLVLYNFAQLALNAWVFSEYLQSGWFSQYSSRCQPVDSDENLTAQRLANAFWWYFISKFTEMLDTVTYLLRRQFRLVSDMHVVHHGLMPISVWAGMKFAPGNQSIFFALINSFVHVVMYFYYMLVSTGLKGRRLLSWKKYLTCLQVMQFLIVMGHQFQFAFSECHYSNGFLLWIILHGICLFLLFSEFYTRKYELQGTANNTNGNKRTALLSARRERLSGYVMNSRDIRFPRFEEHTESHNAERITPPFTLTEEFPSHEKEE